MRMTSLALIAVLASGAALVGCESHNHHRHSEGYHNSDSAVSTGSSASSTINDNRNVNRTGGAPSGGPMTAEEAPRRAGEAVSQQRTGSTDSTISTGSSAASGVNDNRNVNSSSDMPAASGTSTSGTTSGQNAQTPRSGAAASESISDSTNVNRSSDQPATQPSPRSASDR